MDMTKGKGLVCDGFGGCVLWVSHGLSTTKKTMDKFVARLLPLVWFIFLLILDLILAMRSQYLIFGFQFFFSFFGEWVLIL